MKTTSPAMRPVTTRCTVCGHGTAVARIFTDGPRSRYRTWRFVDYVRPVCRARMCPDCGCTVDTEIVMQRKPKEVTVRPEIVEEIKRLKRLGYIMFEGDRRWT